MRACGNIMELAVCFGSVGPSAYLRWLAPVLRRREERLSIGVGFGVRVRVSVKSALAAALGNNHCISRPISG